MQPIRHLFLTNIVLQLEQKTHTNLISPETLLFFLVHYHVFAWLATSTFAQTSHHFSVVSPTGTSAFAIFGQKESWRVTKGEGNKGSNGFSFGVFCEVFVGSSKVGMKELNNWHVLNVQIHFAASRISSHRVHGDWS